MLQFCPVILLISAVISILFYGMIVAFWNCLSISELCITLQMIQAVTMGKISVFQQKKFFPHLPSIGFGEGDFTSLACDTFPPQVWEFDQAHQRWLPVAELALPEDKGDQVYAVAWAPNIGR